MLRLAETQLAVESDFADGDDQDFPELAIIMGENVNHGDFPYIVSPARSN